MPDASDTCSTTTAVTLLNARQQPVELHLRSGVQVLLPGACIALDASQLAMPQVAWLVAQKALVAHAPPAATPPRARAAPAPAPAQAAPGNKAPASRNAAQAVKKSTRAPSGAGRPAARPASTKRASKGEKA